MVQNGKGTHNGDNIAARHQGPRRPPAFHDPSMSDSTGIARTKTRRWRWLIWPALASVALAAGPGRVWYAERHAGDRFYQSGLRAFEAGDLDGLHAAAEGLRLADGAGPRCRLLEGMVLLRSGRLFQAVEEFGFAKDDPQTRLLAYTLSGEALYRAGRYRDALPVLRKAVELDPRATDAHRWLAALYYDIGAMTQATEELAKVAELDPTDPRPSRLRGLMYRDFELYQEAEIQYREALRRGIGPPAVDEVRFELAECLLKLHRGEEAESVLAACPRSARRLALEAECRVTRGDRTAARRLAGEALALEPGHLAASLTVANLDLEANDPGSAVGVLEAAIAVQPKEYRLHYRLSHAYQRLGREAEARRHAELSRRLHDVLLQFAKLHQDAIAQPANAELRCQMGLLALELGKPDLARNWFVAALAMEPGHAGAAKALETMGRSSDAPTSHREPAGGVPSTK